MIRVAMTAFLKTPLLQKCSAASIVACVVQASELGLELTGPLGQAYMVPYWNKHSKCEEAQFQVGYRGLIDLAYRSGKVETFASRVVYANDHFKFRYGTDPKIEHIPTMEDPGEIKAVYAVIRIKGGGFDFEVMSKKQIDEHRAKYSKQKADGNFSPWNTAYEEMAKKTPIRRLAKRVPLSIELVTAAVVDEYGESQAGIGNEGALAIAPPTGQFNFNGNGNGKQPEPVPTGNGAGELAAPKEVRDESPAPEQPKQHFDYIPANEKIVKAIKEEVRRQGDDLAQILKKYECRQVERLSQQKAEELLDQLRGGPEPDLPPRSNRKRSQQPNLLNPRAGVATLGVNTSRRHPCLFPTSEARPNLKPWKDRL